MALHFRRVSTLDGRFQTFRVGIDKAYFPRELWPKQKFTLIYEVVIVRAVSRTDAAHKAWDLNRDKWLPKLSNPKGTVSLYVNSPKAGVGGLMNRLTPVMVFHGSTDC